MVCAKCGQGLTTEARFCSACGQSVAPTPGGPATAGAARRAASPIEGFFQDVASVSLKEIVIVDRARATEILRSPIFLFLCLVAVVPLAIQALEGIKPILNGLAIWSGVLWALLLYRLFSDRELPVTWAIGTVFFTAFIGLPLLEVYLRIPLDVTGLLIRTRFLVVQLVGYVLGVGVREELTKALPLFLMAWLTTRMRKPVEGLVLGMMSGIGFAIAENVVYVFLTLEGALSAVERTGQLGYLVGPIYNNVVRMAMTPFFHGCLSGIFGYFIAMATVERRRRWALLVTGLGLSAGLHGLFDTLVGRSPLYGVLIEAGTFFLVMTYVLKARGLTSARQVAGGVFERTGAIRIPVGQATEALTVPPPSSAAAPPVAQPVSRPVVAGSEEATVRFPPPGARTWHLRGVGGLADGRRYPLGGEVRIGRDAAQCAIHLADANVSRQHAVLTQDAPGGAWRIRRLSATNPLYVNATAVDETPLQAGDRIRIASTTFVIESE